jgi:uncharacterized repeat protein (TIGR01451 family)
MASKRSSTAAGRRLRLQSLEDRFVPDGGAPTITPPTDPTVPAQTGTDTPPPNPAPGGTNTGTGTSQSGTDTPPPNPSPGDVIVPAADPNDPNIIFTTSVDGTPQAPTVDLAAQTTIDRIKPSLGDVVTVKVTVTNNGLVEATGVQVTAALPAGMTFVSSDVGAAKYDPTTGVWTVGTLASKGKAVLTLKAKVTDAAPMDVSAAISHSDQADDTDTNNTSAVSVTPVLGALNLSKTVSTPAVAVGSTVVFTLAVGNAGPGTARGVVVTDTFGSGLAFARVLSSSQGTFNAATGVWNVGTVPAGTTAMLRLVMVVNKFAKIDSPASITGGTGFDPARSKVDATASITGVKPNGMATWSYFAGPMFGMGTSPVPPPAKSQVMPAAPITVVNGGTTTIVPNLMQFLVAAGFKFTGH